MTYSKLYDDAFREQFINEKELENPNYFVYVDDDDQMRKVYDDEVEWDKFVLREMDHGRFYND